MVDEATLKKALASIGDPQQRVYFYERLNNPDLLPMLAKLGEFKEPYRPQENEGRILHPIWPPALYLVNVAEARPTEVAAIIKGIKADNRLINGILMRAVKRMPAPAAATLSDEIRRWVRDTWSDGLHYDVLDVIKTLTNGREWVAAEAIIATVLAVRPARRDEVRTFLSSRFAEARASVGAQLYGFSLERIAKSFGSAEPMLFAALLLTQLRRALKFERLPTSWDYSHIWYERLDEVPISRDVKTLLAHQLWLILKSASALSTEVMSHSLALLENGHSPLFTRMRLMLLAHSDLHEKAKDAAVDLTLFTTNELDVERDEFLSRWFPRFSENIQALIIENARKSFDETKYREWRSANGTDDIEQDVEAARQYSIAGALNVISDYLPRQTKEQIDWAKVGDRKRSRRGASLGPESLIDFTDLASKSTAEILKFVEEWRPRGEPMSPGFVSLARALRPIAAERADEFLSNIAMLKRLPSVYIYHLIDSLKAPVAEARADVNAFLDLLSHVVARRANRISPNTEIDDQDEQGYGWGPSLQMTAFAVTSLVDADRVGANQRAKVWGIIEAISREEDPRPEDDARYEASNANSLALNSPRGAGLLAMIDYARWVKRTTREPLSVCAPEVTAILDERLDNDPSPAIRSTYGQNFGNLFAMDEAWAVNRAHQIFGHDPLREKLTAAAWYSFLQFNGIYDALFKALEEQYTAVTGHVSDQYDENDNDLYASWRTLGAHLLVLYGRGMVDYGSGRSVLDKYVANASFKLLGDLVSYAARTLQQKRPDVFVDRMMHFYSDVLKRAEANSEIARAVLPEFGWWVAISGIDEAWLLQQMLRTLILTGGRTEMEHRVIARLAELSERFPQETIDIVAELACKGSPFIFGYEIEHVTAVFRAAISAGGRALETAIRANDRLSMQGLQGFASLFP